jgi:Cu+-exporting ATPase
MAPNVGISNACTCDPCSCGSDCQCPNCTCQSASVVEMDSSLSMAEEGSAASLQKVVDLAVGGMTCSMCSDAVQTALLQVPGVERVSVSLATNLARVEYKESPECNPEVLQETIEDIGYDVNDVMIQQQRQAAVPKAITTTKTVELAVGGMTCSMCSNAVHAALVDMPGVQTVTVSLSTNVARIQYEESPDCTAEILKETIEDIGYDVDDVIEVMEQTADGDDDMPVNESDDRLQRILKQQDGQLRVRRRDFRRSVLGTLPILTITMVLPNVLAGDSHVMEFLKQNVVLLGHPFVVESLLLWALTTPVQFICGFSFYKTSYYGIMRGILGMDVLVALGTTASYVYAVMATFTGEPGYRFFETSGVLICFVLLGKWMNAMAICRTSEALTQLMKLQAKTALKVTLDKVDVKHWNPLTDSYQEKTVAIQSIHPGDMVKILKGASVPADGVLIHGEMSIDESMITGESIPVLKIPGSVVLGGTICAETGNGSFESNALTAAAFVRVTGVGSSTALAQIVQLVQDAQSRQVPIQNLADSISSIFVPSVVAISIMTFLIWYGCCLGGLVPMDWMQGESPATFSLLFGIACLVISCPCALGLATPTAVMVGTGVGARHGVLMKGGETLEVASKVDTVIFDKTGTLTRGKPAVTDFTRIIPDAFLLDIMKANEMNMGVDDYLVWLLGSLERNSEHPLATAIVSFAEKKLGPLVEETTFAQPSDFLALTGRGASGLINGTTKVSIGNRAFAARDNLEINAEVEEYLRAIENDGNTAIFASINDKVCAVLGIADELKEEAVASVLYLKDMGLDVWMVTGDSKRTADSIAQKLDLPTNRVISEALPVSKVEQVRKLQSLGRCVAMVGDGVNDSPALAEADVGISMGTGAEIATEAADMVLVSGKVSDACTALHLSRVIFRRIQVSCLCGAR